MLPRISAADASITIPLWPQLAPGETTAATGDATEDTTGHYGKITKISVITRPQLFFYPVDDSKRPRPTLLVCPGGGYYVVTDDIEGSEIAHWINSLGYNAAVLHYRVPNYQIPSPARRMPALQDAQRAMSLLRDQAKTLGIDTHHLGIIGFSAGGHLAARLASGHESRAYDTIDAADKESFRPDFALLIYPAYLWDKSANAPAPEVKPSAKMPPLFLMQTRDDDLFDVEDYAAAVKQAGGRAKCLAYDRGGHGYGLRLSKDLPAHHWPDEAAAWIKYEVQPSRKP